MADEEEETIEGGKQIGDTRDSLTLERESRVSLIFRERGHDPYGFREECRLGLIGFSHIWSLEIIPRCVMLIMRYNFLDGCILLS